MMYVNGRRYEPERVPGGGAPSLSVVPVESACAPVQDSGIVDIGGNLPSIGERRLRATSESRSGRSEESSGDGRSSDRSLSRRSSEGRSAAAVALRKQGIVPDLEGRKVLMAEFLNRNDLTGLTQLINDAKLTTLKVADGLQTALKAWASCPSLTTLRVDQQKISMNDLELFVRLLSPRGKNSSAGLLSTLRLSGCELDIAVLRLLFTALSDSCVQKLHLRQLQCEGKWMEPLASLLRRSTSLTALTLMQVGLTPKVAQSVIEAIRHGQLKVLDLSETASGGLPMLAQAIAGGACASLESLGLHWMNEADSTQAVEPLTALIRGGRLTTLNLTGNQFNEAQVGQLIAALEHEACLVRVCKLGEKDGLPTLAQQQRLRQILSSRPGSEIIEMAPVNDVLSLDLERW